MSVRGVLEWSVVDCQWKRERECRVTVTCTRRGVLVLIHVTRRREVRVGMARAISLSNLNRATVTVSDGGVVTDPSSWLVVDDGASGFLNRKLGVITVTANERIELGCDSEPTSTHMTSCR
jgi:hypothetical protein